MEPHPPARAQQFDALPDYAFPRLRALLGDTPPGAEPVMMSIGEPRHAPPEFVREELARGYEDYAKYPPIDGTPVFREACAGWLARRYGVDVTPDAQILPLSGTREGLFLAAVATVPQEKHGARPLVLIPNPFYQCYAAAAIAAGAEPVYVPATAATGHLPDFAGLDPAVLDQTALVYLCSPANPQGAAASLPYLCALLMLAERHDFRIAFDECYTEIYTAAPPAGALQALAETGVSPDRLMGFHSLSKRSNLAGLRSGFVVGGPQTISVFKRLRSYVGPTLPLPTLRASALAWDDDAHVVENRALYAEKFAAAETLLGDLPGWARPDGGFFLWIPVDDDEAAALTLWRDHGVRVLPGSYLARTDPRFPEAGDPGAGWLRAALVEPLESVTRGLKAIRRVAAS